MPGGPQLSLQHNPPHKYKYKNAKCVTIFISCCVEFYLATCISQNDPASRTKVTPMHSVQWLILSSSTWKTKHLVKTTLLLLYLKWHRLLPGLSFFKSHFLTKLGIVWFLSPISYLANHGLVDTQVRNSVLLLFDRKWWLSLRIWWFFL